MERRWLLGIAGIAWAIAAWTLWSTLQGVASAEQPLPLLDHWATVRAAERWYAGEYGLADWLSTHNEHRIPFARLLYWADIEWGAMSGHLLLAAVAALQALTAALLLLAARPVLRAAAPSAWRPWWWTLAGVVTCWMFAGVHIANLAEPFQVTFVLVYPATTAAFAAVARARHSPRPRAWIAAAMAAGVVAAGAMANGLLVWPMLVLQAWMLRLSRGTVAALAAVGAATIGMYLVGYESPRHHGSPMAHLMNPLGLLRYLCATLGNPIRDTNAAPHLLLPTIAGATGLALVLLLAWSERRRADGTAAGAGRLALLATACFVVGTAALAGVGRLGFGVGSAMASRYGTPAMVFWAAVLLLLASRPDQLGVFVVLLVGLMHVALLGQQDAAIANARNLRLGLQSATTAGLCSVHDLTAMHDKVTPSPDYTFSNLVPFLRDRDLSVFADEPQRALGLPLAAVLGDAEVELVPGRIEHATAVPDTGWGFRLDGRMSLPGGAPPATPPTRGWFVDGDDAVIGLLLVDPRDTTAIAFVGHAAARAQSSPVTAVVPWTTGRALRLRVPTILAAEFVERPGAAIAGSGVQLVGGFAAPAAGQLPPPPTDAPVFVSTAAGKAVMTIEPVRARRALGLPLLTGACPLGCGFAVLDAATRQPLRFLHPATTYGQWRTWRIELPPEWRDRPLAITIADLGVYRDQWFAVQPPTALDD